MHLLQHLPQNLPHQIRRIGSLILILNVLSCAANVENSSSNCSFDSGIIVPGPDNAQLLASQYYLNKGSASNTLNLNLPENARSLTGSAGKGMGVSVAVLDSGTDIFHEDLRPNISYENNLNLLQGVPGNSPCLRNPTFTDRFGELVAHGTKVSGIIAARDYNGMGIRGVAPRVSLSGVNYVMNPTQANLTRIVDHLIDRKIMVTNNSFGLIDGTGLLLPIPRSLEKEWERLVNVDPSRGASVRGTSTHSISALFAIGNGGAGIEFRFDNRRNTLFYRRRKDVNNYYSIDHAGLSLETSLFSSISVASVDADGTRSLFSERGASVWIAGFGDQITTVDLKNRYVPNFNGTSASVPIVSGVVALILEAAAAANKTVSYRDVRLILAESGRIPKKSGTPLISTVTNQGQKYSGASGGYDFNPQYGFGLVDADAAVGLTKIWTPIPRTQPLRTVTVMSPNPLSSGQAFADNDETGASNVLTVSQTEISRIEFMYVFLQTKDSDHGDLEVSLQGSGSTGTKIVLSEPHYCFSRRTQNRRMAFRSSCSPVAGMSADFEINGAPWRFGNAAHLGESPNQDWTIRVKDLNKDNETVPSVLRAPRAGQKSVANHDPDGGEIVRWGIRFFGR